MVRYDVRCFPSDDVAFSGAVRRGLEAIGDSDDPLIVASRLNAALRPAYPSVEVRPGDPLAELTPRSRILYAFRDGPVLAFDPTD